MARQTFVFDRAQQKMVPAAEFYRRKWEGVKVSDLPRPMIISDSLDDTMNPADGKQYNSKSAYYKAVRKAGCEIIGNEKTSVSERKTLDDPINDIKRAIHSHGR
jgi:hypothetical protein